MQNDTEEVYKYYREALKFTSTDRQKIKVYNKLIVASEKNDDFSNLIIFLDELYNIIEDEIT